MSARILIVDDVAANLRLLEAKLAIEYYETACATDGFSTLMKARQWRPDLILLDVMMPGMDGYACCRLLKAEKPTFNIPVVMVTALDEPSERVRGLEAGADDFLTKPVDYDILLARVSSLIRLKRLVDEWRSRNETVLALGVELSGFAIEEPLPANVLVVGTTGLNLEAFSKALEVERVTVSHCHTGAAALRLAETNQYHLFVLNFPALNESVTKTILALRASEGSHTIPILLAIEVFDKEKALRCFDLGVSDWIILPLDPNELRVRCRNQLRQKFYHDRVKEDLDSALKMAVIDPLTGLYNKRYLLNYADLALKGGRLKCSTILVIDVDHFKQVNDTYGHMRGDEILRNVACLIKTSSRVGDIVIRYGGEEFVVLMQDINISDATKIAELIRSTVEADFIMAGPPAVTVSIGMSYSEEEPTGFDALLRSADSALYRAKRHGRNRVEVVKLIML